VTRLPFPALMQAVAGRYLDLMNAYGPGRPDWPVPELLDAANEIGCPEADLRLVAGQRWSSRQRQRVPLQGLLGHVRYTGALAPFAGLLQAAELLHVGKGTTCGQGRLRVAFREPGRRWETS